MIAKRKVVVRGSAVAYGIFDMGSSSGKLWRDIAIVEPNDAMKSRRWVLQLL